MRRGVAEQFPAARNHAVAVSVQSEPRIVGLRTRPRQSFVCAVVVDVERNAVCRIGQFKTVAVNINDNRRTLAGIRITFGKTVAGIVVVAAEAIASADKIRTARAGRTIITKS